MKTFYYYLYYQFYHLFETSIMPFSSYWKAANLISAFEGLILLTIPIYIIVLTKTKFDVSLICLIFFLIIVVRNILIFESDTERNKYFRKFNKFSTRKKVTLALCTMAGICLIVANLVFAFYCLSRVAPYLK